MPEKPCKDIVVIDGATPGKNDKFIKDARAMYSGAIIATSVEDMVTKILEKLEAHKDDCDCINVLKIIGHGGEGCIIVGNGRSPADDAKRINGKNTGSDTFVTNEATWEPHLKKLKGKFCKKGKIEVLSCYFGAGDKGAKKLLALAKATGAIVSGYNCELLGSGTPEKPNASGVKENVAKPTDSAPPAKVDAFNSMLSSPLLQPTPLSLVAGGRIDKIAVIGGEQLPSFDAVPPASMISGADAIAAVMGQIELDRQVDISRIGGITDGHLLIWPAGGDPVAFEICDNVFHVGSSDDREAFHTVKPAGRQRLLALLDARRSSG